jgi:hypothetical protein
VGINQLNRTHLYHSTLKRCRDCSQKSQCTRGKYRILAIHTCEPARQRAYALAKTPGFVQSQRDRRKVEALFAELKAVGPHPRWQPCEPGTSKDEIQNLMAEPRPEPL